MQCIVILLAILFVSGGLVADSSAALPSSNISDCIDSSDYLRIESSLLNRSENLVNLYQAFFPTNQQASISVQVTYHFTNSSETVIYRWLDSSVLMLIRGDLLHYLSLFAYNVKTRYTDITLDPICDFSNDDKVTISDPSDYCKLATYNSTGHHLLNNLTANLLSYAMHHKSLITNGIDSTIESGYAVYVFNSSNPSDYCIFDEVPNFVRLRMLLCIAFGLLEISSVFSVPLLLASMYERFKEKMSEQNLRYFVWATLVLIVLIIPLFIVCNILALVNGLTPSTHFNDISTAFSVMAAAMIFFPVVDTIAATCVMIRFRFIEEFCYKINCFGFRDYSNEDEIFSICVKNTTHICAIVAVTWFTQLALFNSIYVFIGAVAAPVETGSLLLLYLTSLFALISFFAVILKVFHKTAQANVVPVAQAGMGHVEVHQNKRARRFVCLVYFLLLVALVGVLAAGIGVFVTFMYVYIALNQEYRNDRGILTFLGALLPSLLASASGLFWMRIMRCIGKENNDTEIRNRIDEHMNQLMEEGIVRRNPPPRPPLLPEEERPLLSSSLSTTTNF